MIGRRLTDPLQTEDPDQRTPDVVLEVMWLYEDQIVFPSMAQIRKQLGLDE